MQRTCLNMSIFFSLVLGACAGQENAQAENDSDGDGYEATLDCDDTDAAVFPGASEYCNGVDDDCDALVDEDAVDAFPWYVDQDGDGHGAETDPVYACQQPSGFVDSHDDCDDHNPAAFPGSGETWYDGVDQDCLGDSDFDADGDGYDWQRFDGEDCDDTDPGINPAAAETWYDGVDQNCDGKDDFDADADGYSSQASGGFDCDDSDGDVHPGAFETWYDGVDQNCDGKDDFDADEDGYQSTDFGGDDCDDGNSMVYPEAREYCDGLDDDCDGEVDQHCEYSLAEADAIILGATENGALGTLVLLGGDMNGDGFDDIVASAPSENNDDEYPGRIYIFDGPRAGTVTTEDATGNIHVSTSNVGLGEALDMAGDMDLDGLDDLLLGAPYSNYGDNRAGAVYLFTGPLSGSNDLEADADAVLYGEVQNQNAGISLATVGDTDGDGTGDTVVGYSQVDRETFGGAYLLLSRPLETAALADLGITIEGDETDEYGSVVARAGDLNADGFADFMIGSERAGTESLSSCGIVWVFLGPLTSDATLGEADSVINGEESGDQAGASVAGGGDLDGDGFDDLLIGASRNRGDYVQSGAAYVVPGPPRKSVDLSDAPTKLYGEDERGMAGSAVAWAGDVNLDGYSELLVGAPGEASRGGNTYLFTGPLSGMTALSSCDRYFYGGTDGMMSGSSLDAGGDSDGDGVPDLVLGVSMDSTLAERAGALYLVSGAGF